MTSSIMSVITNALAGVIACGARLSTGTGDSSGRVEAGRAPSPGCFDESEAVAADAPAARPAGFVASSGVPAGSHELHASKGAARKTSRPDASCTESMK
jgi:hypothetical protein